MGPREQRSYSEDETDHGKGIGSLGFPESIGNTYTHTHTWGWRRRQRRRRWRQNFLPPPAPIPSRTGMKYPVRATPHSDVYLPLDLGPNSMQFSSINISDFQLYKTP